MACGLNLPQTAFFSHTEVAVAACGPPPALWPCSSSGQGPDHDHAEGGGACGPSWDRMVQQPPLRQQLYMQPAAATAPSSYAFDDYEAWDEEEQGASGVYRSHAVQQQYCGPNMGRQEERQEHGQVRGGGGGRKG